MLVLKPVSPLNQCRIHALGNMRLYKRFTPINYHRLSMMKVQCIDTSSRRHPTPTTNSNRSNVLTFRTKPITPQLPAPPTTTNEITQQDDDKYSISSEVILLVGMITAVSFICSIDRAAMSTAILPMSEMFHWDNDVKGAVSSSFFFGYTVSNLAGSYLSTRFSPKTVLGSGVLVWSLFTVFTPMAAASSLPDLLAVRGSMGLGEGVAYPCVQNLVQASVPHHARSRALAFIYSGHQLGTIASYLLAPLLISEFGWQSVFFCFGVLGFVWLGCAALLPSSSPNTDTLDDKTPLSARYIMPKSNTPSGSGGISPSSAAVRLEDIPWQEIVCNKSFWAIVAAQTTVSIGSTLSFSWLPTYYSEVFNVDVAHSAAFCLVPFIATVLATNASGWIADGMCNSGFASRTNIRKIMQAVASLGPAACLMNLASQSSGADTSENGILNAVVMVTAWLSLGGFSAAGYGSNHQDISQKYAGLLFGMANAVASLAASASVYTTGMVLKETHDWGLIFSGAALMYVVGSGVYFCWASAEKQFD